VLRLWLPPSTKNNWDFYPTSPDSGVRVFCKKFSYSTLMNSVSKHGKFSKANSRLNHTSQQACPLRASKIWWIPLCIPCCCSNLNDRRILNTIYTICTEHNLGIRDPWKEEDILAYCDMNFRLAK